jgi:hypothetical protein
MLDLQPSLEWRWDPVEHINAVAERGLNVLFAPGQKGYNCVPINLYLGPQGKEYEEDACRFFPDDPEIGVSFDQRRHTLELIFNSDYLEGRQVRSNDWMHWLLHLSLQPDAVNDTPCVADTLDRYTHAYIEAVKDQIVNFDPKGLGPDAGVPIRYWPDEDARRRGRAALVTKTVPVIPFLGWATCWTKPLMRGVPAFTAAQVYVEDKAAVDYFMSYLELDRRAALMNVKAVMLSYRHWLLTTVLGVTPYNLDDIICVVTNGRAS